MDALKNALSGNKAGNTSTTSGAGLGGSNTAPTGQKDDFGDKGAGYVNKKYFGNKLGHDQLEKITDAGRENIEKMTGKDIPDKFSN
ncbi:hypothetical protein HD806DRAFT_540569 [Xylariaceae sp. AK1471]|nr:hypothetical protein HD806DRAFT_540569 [Xylariaceae sp. AK1471]